MMNYSDYDSDGYSSNDDADYVPSEDNLSEDDINECEQEEPLQQEESHPPPGEQRRRKEQSGRKRKKGVLKLDQEEKEDQEEERGGEEVQRPPAKAREQEEQEEQEEEKEEKQKKKSDDLWACFLSDVGSRPCDPAAPPSGPSHKGGAAERQEAPRRPEGAKVTITRVFDFAGEEVRVKKEVCADSKEAKSYLKNHQEEEEEESSSPSQTAPPGPSGKRGAAGLSSVLLGRLGGKKQKMSTLEKSKMDWDAFKSEEGITEELAIHNRGREGYVERKNFLDRVDHRQFELEKAVRQSNMKQ